MLAFGLAEGEAGDDVEQIGPSPGLVDLARARGHDRLVLAIDLQGDLIIRQWNDLTGGQLERYSNRDTDSMDYHELILARPDMVAG